MISHVGPVQKIVVKIPGAVSVYILGDFNNWSTSATPMSNLGDGLWEAVLDKSERMSQVCFFVWERGQAFGRVVRKQLGDLQIVPDMPAQVVIIGQEAQRTLSSAPPLMAI